MDIDVTTSTHGPLFSGTAAASIARYVDDTEAEIATQGYDDVQQTLRTVLRHPTGRYQSRIQVSTRADTRVISDGNIIYGNWLEGTGSRNRTTRFKGYFTFRRVRQGLGRKAKVIAEKNLDRLVGRL